MMIQAIRLTRKKAALAVILAGAVLAALILLLGQRGGAGASEQPCLSSNGERVAYLRELGWEIDPEPLTTLQFLLPPKLSGDYITSKVFCFEGVLDKASALWSSYKFNSIGLSKFLCYFPFIVTAFIAASLTPPNIFRILLLLLCYRLFCGKFHIYYSFQSNS